MRESKLEGRIKVVCLFALTLMASVANAQPAPELPWMTGDRLVKLLGNVDPGTVPWSPQSPFPSRAVAAQYRDMLNGEFVHGYIQALHDASEGKGWCWNHYKPKPHELVEDARRTLQRMPDVQLKRNAADLIVEHWRQKFPCTSGVERRNK